MKKRQGFIEVFNFFLRKYSHYVFKKSFDWCAYNKGCNISLLCTQRDESCKTIQINWLTKFRKLSIKQFSLVVYYNQKSVKK